MAETPNSETGSHRSGFATRSGDSHVIGDDDHAEAVNVDQLARDAAAAEAAKAARPGRAGRDAAKPAESTSDFPAAA